MSITRYQEVISLAVFDDVELEDVAEHSLRALRDAAGEGVVIIAQDGTIWGARFSYCQYGPPNNPCEFWMGHEGDCSWEYDKPWDQPQAKALPTLRVTRGH